MGKNILRPLNMSLFTVHKVTVAFVRECLFCLPWFSPFSSSSSSKEKKKKKKNIHIVSLNSKDQTAELLLLPHKEAFLPLGFTLSYHKITLFFFS